ncbi:alpha/beta hydrolase [Nocardioides nanhaiensis]|uniref:Alpha/beta hydrolase fold-3 domain-containing protein n=1 Tax=Nocardioides nanhaiensis TaxID=1476871 RepID=A0ABP8VVF4_9ACTN
MTAPKQPAAAPLDPELETLRLGAAAAGGPPLVRLSPQEARARVTAGDRLCSDGPQVPTLDLDPQDDGPPVRVRVYEPEACRGTLVYAHGGGWVTGDLEYSDELCRHLAVGVGLRVVSVDYRLAPEHPFPVGLDDLDGAWRWAEGCFGDGPLALGGDSAGGHLAAALTHRLVARGAPPALLLLVYPVLGRVGATASYDRCADAFPVGRDDMQWFWDHYTSGGGSRRAGVEVSAPDLLPGSVPVQPGHPPTHLVLAGHDPLHDEGLAHAQRLADAGVRVSVQQHATLCHGFLRVTGACAAARQALAGLVRAANAAWPQAETTAAPKLCL